ncbi:unnamed protein product, partial [Porites lobata]
TNSDRLSVSQERHAPNPAYQGFQDQQLQRRSCIENLRDGLADWFVIRHTKDEALSSDLFSNYGFYASDATQIHLLILWPNSCTDVALRAGLVSSLGTPIEIPAAGAE